MYGRSCENISHPILTIYTAEKEHPSREQLNGYSASVWAGLCQPQTSKKLAYSNVLKDPDTSARDLASGSWASIILTQTRAAEIATVAVI